MRVDAVVLLFNNLDFRRFFQRPSASPEARFTVLRFQRCLGAPIQRRHITKGILSLRFTRDSLTWVLLSMAIATNSPAVS